MKRFCTSYTMIATPNRGPIAAVRGITPRNRAEVPSFVMVSLATSTTPPGTPACILVLMTSKGVEIAAAKDPARIPLANDLDVWALGESSGCIQVSFILACIGKKNTENHTSRMRVGV
mmetsp:Transcript_7574/g.11405  ORF Transcript_7574/g.11405 Transcript_7574/m.11405 type:complete len:118 (-) Transcript_7574:540-893(-)